MEPLQRSTDRGAAQYLLRTKAAEASDLRVEHQANPLAGRPHTPDQSAWHWRRGWSPFSSLSVQQR